VPPHLADGTRFLKTPVAVKRGRRVTISVPPADRGAVGLVYGANPLARVRIEDGQHTVTFVGCDPNIYGQDSTEDFFNGGFLLRGPRCVPLLVDHAGRAQQVALAFGAGRCPA
jgi:hypothetical protein